MRTIGLDPSLTSFGFATPEAVGVLKSKARGVERLIDLRNRVDRICCEDTPHQRREHRADLVVIEGYSLGTQRQTSHAHALGELGGVIRVLLYTRGIPVVEIAPASLKRYATGKGNASKEQVLAAGVQRSRVAFNSSDECDAWWLRVMAMDHYGEPVVKMPETHRSALKVIEWPTLQFVEVVPA